MDALETTTQFTQRLSAGSPVEDLVLGEDQELHSLVRQVQRKGLTVDPLGRPWQHEGRGIAWAVLSRPDRPRPLGDLWLLLQQEGEDWKVVGYTKLRPQAVLFLRGELPASVDLEALPVHEGARHWAESALPLLEKGDLSPLQGLEGGVARLLPGGQPVAITIGRTVHLEAVHRAAVGLEVSGETAWVVLDVAETTRPVAAAPYLNLEQLLTGIEVPFPGREGDGSLRPDIRETLYRALDEVVPADTPADAPMRQKAEQMRQQLDEALKAAEERDRIRRE